MIKKTTGATFVIVLRILAASAWELLQDFSIANTSLCESVREGILLFFRLPAVPFRISE